MRVINNRKISFNFFPFLLIAIIALLIAACGGGGGNGEATLKRQIRQLAKDGEISAADCKALHATIEEHEDLAGTDLEALIKSTNSRKEITIDCGDELPPSGENKEAVPPAAAGKLNYNVYVENSGSMYGYMNTNSEFKKCLYDLLTRFNGADEKFDLKIINNKVFNLDEEAKVPTGASVTERLRTLTDYMDESKLKKLGDYRSSKINELFDLVITQIKADKRPAVLISDFIYSVKGQNMQSELAEEKYHTKTVFQGLKNGYEVLVIKGSSKFSGKYYAFDDSNSAVTETRPFYIWVIGTSAQIGDFVSKYNVDNLPGYKNYMAFDRPENTTPYHSILLKTAKEGSFKPSEPGSKEIHGIKDTRLDARHDEFGFSLAMNLSGLNKPADYFEEKETYEATSSGGDELEVFGGKPIELVEPNDKKYCGEATHYITIETPSISRKKHEITVRVLNKLPKWVAESSTEDDRTKDKRNDKTFGFNYLMEGVFEAFYGEKDNPAFYEFTLNINE